MSYSNLTTKAKINEDGSVSGIYEDLDVGLFAMNAKENYDENPEKYKKQYKENFSVDFTDIKTNLLENGDFEAKMSFTSNNMIDNIGNCGNRYVAGFCNFFYGRHGNLLPFFLSC